MGGKWSISRFTAYQHERQGSLNFRRSRSSAQELKIRVFFPLKSRKSLSLHACVRALRWHSQTFYTTPRISSLPGPTSGVPRLSQSSLYSTEPSSIRIRIKAARRFCTHTHTKTVHNLRGEENPRNISIGGGGGSTNFKHSYFQQ